MFGKRIFERVTEVYKVNGATFRNKKHEIVFDAIEYLKDSDDKTYRYNDVPVTQRYDIVTNADQSPFEFKKFDESVTDFYKLVLDDDNHYQTVGESKLLNTEKYVFAKNGDDPIFEGEKIKVFVSKFGEGGAEETTEEFVDSPFDVPPPPLPFEPLNSTVNLALEDLFIEKDDFVANVSVTINDLKRINSGENKVLDKMIFSLERARQNATTQISQKLTDKWIRLSNLGNISVDRKTDSMKTLITETLTSLLAIENYVEIQLREVLNQKKQFTIYDETIEISKAIAELLHRQRTAAGVLSDITRKAESEIDSRYGKVEQALEAVTALENEDKTK